MTSQSQGVSAAKTTHANSDNGAGQRFDSEVKDAQTHAKSSVAGGGNTPQAAQSCTKTVTVQEGNTLWGLAKEHVGQAGQWPSIYQDNKAQIANPNLIFPGQSLTIKNAKCDTPQGNNSLVQPQTSSDDSKLGQVSPQPKAKPDQPKAIPEQKPAATATPDTKPPAADASPKTFKTWAEAFTPDVIGYGGILGPKTPGGLAKYAGGAFIVDKLGDDGGKSQKTLFLTGPKIGATSAGYAFRPVATMPINSVSQVVKGELDWSKVQTGIGFATPLNVGKTNVGIVLGNFRVPVNLFNAEKGIPAGFIGQLHGMIAVTGSLTGLPSIAMPKKYSAVSDALNKSQAFGNPQVGPGWSVQANFKDGAFTGFTKGGKEFHVPGLDSMAANATKLIPGGAGEGGPLRDLSKPMSADEKIVAQFDNKIHGAADTAAAGTGLAITAAETVGTMALTGGNIGATAGVLVADHYVGKGIDAVSDRVSQTPAERSKAVESKGLDPKLDTRQVVAAQTDFLHRAWAKTAADFNAGYLDKKEDFGRNSPSEQRWLELDRKYDTPAIPTKTGREGQVIETLQSVNKALEKGSEMLIPGLATVHSFGAKDVGKGIAYVEEGWRRASDATSSVTHWVGESADKIGQSVSESWDKRPWK